MHPIEALIRNPVKVWVGVLLLMLFGTIAWLGMPMQLTPEVQVPKLTVETVWPGASPQEVERQIIDKQEEQLKAVENVVKMDAEAMESLGRITLEFAVGTDLNVAASNVSKRLEQVPSYPEDADKPVVVSSSSSDSPIAWFILSAKMRPLEEFEKFAAEHGELQADLAPIMKAMRDGRTGLAELRLRRLVREKPEAPALAELLPKITDVPLQRNFAVRNIETAFERVDGVSNSNVIGGRDPELQVLVDPEKLAARQLTIQHVRNALRAQNKDTSAGDLWEGKRRWVVRVLGEFDSPQDVEEQPLAVYEGRPVFVRDVAEVRLTHKKPDGFVKRFGTECIAVNVLRRTGANVLEIMDDLRVKNRELNEGMLAQRGLTLTQVYDETEYIYSAVGMVRENIFSGAALTMITLMLFLHLNRRTLFFAPIIGITAIAAIYVSSWLFAATLLCVVIAGLWFARGALVVSLAIPVSIIGTFILLGGLGRSLNVISLAGMAFAVGMLVDNAVVVLENIVRHHQAGRSPMEASIIGTKEVWTAVLASTLTTLAVFLPVVFIKEEAGQLFGDIALAICGAIGLSLVVSITLIPVAAARLLPEHGSAEDDTVSSFDEHGRLRNAHAGWLVGFITLLGNWFSQSIDGTNRVLHASWMLRIVFAGAVTAIACFLAYVLWPNVEYLPNGNRNLVIGLVLPPPGYNLGELNNLGQIVEDELRPLWDFEPEDEKWKKSAVPPIEDFFYVARGKQVFVGMRSHDPLRAGLLVPEIMKLTAKMPGSFAVAFQSSLFQQGLQGGRSIDVDISGPELSELVRLGGGILVQSMGVLGPGTQVRPVPSLDLSSPEIHVEPRLVSAAEMGVTADDLGYAMNALIDGAYAGDYFDHGEKIDLSIVGRVGTIDSTSRTQDIADLPVAVTGGLLVPVSALANVSLRSGPEQINHRERRRAITIQVTPPPTMPLEQAIMKIETEIIAPLRAANAVPPDYQLSLSGTADKLQKTWLALRGNLLLALLITYLLMAALFESWSHPFVIILSVPLGAVGGVLGLVCLNYYLMLRGEPPQALDVLTMLGFVILIGTVVNNPILIVEQALLNMRERDMTAAEGVIDAARTRIRPIFMTTLTTVIGLAPLVLFPGAGSELYRGLGSVLLGGLLVSTLISLVLIPALFSAMAELGQWLSSEKKTSSTPQ